MAGPTTRTSLREDARKRSAIVASGRFWVWSVTHQDVAAALSGSPATDLESPLVAMARNDGAKRTGQRPPPAGESVHAERGRAPPALAGDWPWCGRGDHSLDVMQRNAAWLGFRMIPSTPQDQAACEAQRARGSAEAAPLRPRARRRLRACDVAVERTCCAWSAAGRWCSRRGCPRRRAWMAPAVAVLDEAASADEEALHGGWRRWLQVAQRDAVPAGLPGIHDVWSRGARLRPFRWPRRRARCASEPSGPRPRSAPHGSRR